MHFSRFSSIHTFQQHNDYVIIDKRRNEICVGVLRPVFHLQNCRSCDACSRLRYFPTTQFLQMFTAVFYTHDVMFAVRLFYDYSMVSWYRKSRISDAVCWYFFIIVV